MTIYRRSLRLGLASFAAILALLASVSLTAAHEHRHVGDYEITIGFLGEPAIVEEPNGLDLRVMKGEGDAATPVEGLAGSLEAEVTFGGQTRALEIRPAFGQPGHYKSDFIPTEEGAYTFHITGTIEGTPVDESFTSGPDTFSEVSSRTTLMFPTEIEPAGAIAATASDAQDSASTAMMVAIAGVVVGALGLIVGALGLMAARRAPATDQVAAPRAQQETGD